MVLPHDEQGAGPAVVLLHAGIADRRMWREHLAPLAGAGYRVLAVDLPGFGEAPMPEEPPQPWLDVLATMDALDVARAALVGSSFGGAIAQRIAAVAPERVTALALVSTPAEEVEPSPQLIAAWDAEEEALERGDVEAAIEAVLDAWTLPDASPEIRELVAAMQRRAFELQAGAEGIDELADPLERDPAALGRFAGPVLLAVGERDMSDFHEAAEMLAGLLPQARRETIAGAGHLAPLEQPDAFGELILAFLGESLPDDSA
jgi:pimeloyl-ACP methyl ester carboxylesterase